MKRIVTFGELLLSLGTKNHSRLEQSEEFVVRYTGAEANVAVSLANYGFEAFAVSKVPTHEIGQACVNALRRYGVNTDYIVRGGQRLGLLYLEPGAAQRPSKVIYDRAQSSFCTLQQSELDWETILAGKDWLHFTGTAPAQGQEVVNILTAGLKTAKRLNLNVSCDLNFRRKLWSVERAREVMTALMEYVDVLFTNEEEAACVFGIEARGSDVHAGKISQHGYEDLVAQLHQKFNLKYVSVSLRESVSATINNWSGMLYDGKQCCTSRKYHIDHIIDRVGGGDAYSAGVIYSILTGRNLQETVEFAAAASCLKHSIPGDFNLVSLDEVLALMGGDGSGRIQR